MISATQFTRRYAVDHEQLIAAAMVGKLMPHCTRNRYTARYASGLLPGIRLRISRKSCSAHSARSTSAESCNLSCNLVMLTRRIPEVVTRCLCREARHQPIGWYPAP